MAKKNEKAEETALEKKETGALEVFDYGDDAGAGFEGQTQEDLSIPFYVVLQSNSPQVAEERNGAKPGKLYNTVTEEILSELYFVPAFKEHIFTEWVPRDAGGGFVGVHAPDSQIVKAAKESSEKFGKYQTPEGNDLVETFQVFVAETDAEGNPNGNFGVLAFTSTKIKRYKKWNTAIFAFQINVNGRKQNPPLFAHRVKLSTKKESNPKGVFYNVELSPSCGSLRDSLLPPGHPAMDAARALADMVRQGKAQAAHDSSGAAETSDDGTPF